MVISVICFGQFFESLRINAVLDVRTIDAKKDDLPATLYGQLCCGTERYVLKRYGWSASPLWRGGLLRRGSLLRHLLSASEVGRSSQRGSAAKRRRTFQKAPAA